MTTEYSKDYAHYKPRRSSHAPLIFMVLMLPVFFLFGFVANETMNDTRGNGIQVGIGGGPDVTPINSSETKILSPTPDSMIEDQNSSVASESSE